jgi:25S rRNA (adenine2142-N1)-methyltransferase
VVAVARRLLCTDAGLLLIVTPLSTDRCVPRSRSRLPGRARSAHALMYRRCRSHRPERALPVMKEWRAAIEALGFARFAAARLPTVHALAFRAVAAPSPPMPLAPMRIAYDGLSAAEAAEAARAEAQGASGA